jgi:hypothetical protein
MAVRYHRYRKRKSLAYTIYDLWRLCRKHKSDIKSIKSFTEICIGDAIVKYSQYTIDTTIIFLIPARSPTRNDVYCHHWTDMKDHYFKRLDEPELFISLRDLYDYNRFKLIILDQLDEIRRQHYALTHHSYIL